jgi:cellulose synthase (UDP-forming)
MIFLLLVTWAVWAWVLQGRPRMYYILMTTWMAGVWYLYWRWTATEWSWNTWQGWFLWGETIALGHMLMTLLLLTRSRDRRPDAATSAPHHPRLVVLMPTYKEPRHVIEPAIRAACRMDWPTPVEVYVGDDGHRDWLPGLCETCGAIYVHGPKKHAKAGNLNEMLAHVRRKGPISQCLIVVFDADFIPVRQAAHRLWNALFRDPSAGIMQTPQHFYNHDPVQWNLGIRGVTEEQRWFCDVVEPARDAWGTAFCIGTGVMIRGRVIEDLGGSWPHACITEDLYLTMAAHAHGWKTGYLNESIALGLAAESIGEYIQQRSRWCLGTMQALWLPYGPFRNPSMHWMLRGAFLDMAWYWIGFLFLAMLLWAGPIGWWLNNPAIVIPPDASLMPLWGRMIVFMIGLGWMSEGRILPLVTDISKAVTLVHIIPAIIGGLWKPEGRGFAVTTKGIALKEPVPRWGLMAPFMGMLAITILGAWQGLSAEGTWMTTSVIINLALSAYGSLVMIGCITVCIDRPRHQDQHPSLTGSWPAIWSWITKR